jgi:ABC-2 type transport system ATP-binding protein
MPGDIVISTLGLAKHYGAVKAVDGIDLAVRRGEIYGFLGRNGAGKTTTIRALLGLVRPTRGHATILGRRVQPGEQAVFARVGSLVETATAYANLTVLENLEIQRRLCGAGRQAVDAVIDLMSLRPYARRLAGHLSLGNKQRLALARALVHSPEVMILDEPANGLDPAGIIEVRELLRRLADEQGVGILISSHILAEVAHLADRIGIIHAGKLVEELSLDELRAKAQRYLKIGVSKPDQAIKLLGTQLGLTRIEAGPDGSLRVLDGPDHAAAIARVLIEGGHDLTALCTQEEDLEAHFMRLTGGVA